MDAIIVDGTRYNRTEKGFEFELEYDQPFMGEIIWSDVDGDEVKIGLEQPSNGLVLINYTLVMLSYHSADPIVTFLNITDGNGSELQRIPLTIHINIPSPPTLLGISFDNEKVDVPFNGEYINITIPEREEITVYFLFENAPEAYIIDLRDPGKPSGMLNVSGRSAVVFGADVKNASELFEFDLGWVLNIEADGYYGFRLMVTVLNVNRAPTGLDISAEEPFYVNKEVVFTVTQAVDPDGDLLAYSIDWDDGTGPGYWAPGEELEHTFTSTGEFVVTITVEDSWGATLTSSILVNVQEGGMPDDDDTEDDDVQGENDDLGIVIAIIAVVVILFLIGFVIFFLRSPDREEKEEEEGEEYIHPLERALMKSMEE
jgi:hypothetical protein